MDIFSTITFKGIISKIKTVSLSAYCCYGLLEKDTYAGQQSHLFRITLGKMPITNRCEYSNDGGVLKGIDGHHEHVAIETRENEVTATQSAHGADESLSNDSGFT